MKPSQVVGVIFGLILMLVAIGAYYSGEASTRTEQGQISIALALLIGIMVIFGSLSSKKKDQKAEQQPVAVAQQLAPGVTGKCPSCGRDVASEYLVCPYCGKVLRKKCPACGKEVSPDFVMCPYCARPLRVEPEEPPPPPPSP